MEVNPDFISPFISMEEDPKGLEKFAYPRLIPLHFYTAEGAEFDGLE